MTDSEARDATNNRKRMSSLLWLGLCCLVFIILFLVRGENRDQRVASIDDPIDAQRVASTEGRPMEVLPEGFVSSAGCRQCHEKEYDSWHASYHRTMTQVVIADTAPEVIRDNAVTVEGVLYRFEQEGEQIFVTFRDPLAHGEVRRRQIVLMTGSHHMHVFWYESDFKHTPGQLQIIFLRDEQRWIPRRSAFLRPPDLHKSLELGRWNQTCSKCHSTHPRQRLDRESRIWDTHVVEFGIACEACHGQGEQHARHHAQGGQNSTAEDKIINPQTVSQHASADICGRCHSISIPNFAARSEDEYFEQGNPFEPGQLLAQCEFNCIVQASPEHRETDTFRRWTQDYVLTESFWSDGMPRISGREYNGLIESPCYLHGDMTCLSCHTMHPSEDQSLDAWRDDQLKPGMRGDKACLQCHADYAEEITQHTHHQPGSSGSRCMNCHMPYTTYGLLKTIRSHQISSPSVITSATTDRPSACVLCHLDRSFAWTSSHLHDWYGQPAVKIDLDSDVAKTSAAVIHFLKGDAAQRAVQASAFGWQPAREVSGTQWMEPFLLLGTSDPYDAVRIISARSLRSLPARISGEVDPLADWQQRLTAFNAAISEIDKNLRVDPNPEVLIDGNGAFDFMRAREIAEQRNHRPIYLRE